MAVIPNPIDPAEEPEQLPEEALPPGAIDVGELSCTTLFPVLATFFALVLYELELGELIPFLGSFDFDDISDIDAKCVQLLNASTEGIRQVETVMEDLGVKNFRGPRVDEAESGEDSDSDPDWLPDD